MKSRTPYFKCFGPLLFGKPPVDSLKKALAKLAQCNSLSEIRKIFGALLPAILLAREKEGDNSRIRLFSLDVTFWAFLDQILSPGSSCREAARKIMASRIRKSPNEPIGKMSASTAAYTKARARIPLKTIGKINTHLVDRMQGNTLLRSLWHGRRVKLVDGTSVSMPDTPANQAQWPQSKSQKKGCGFPVMKVVGLFCLATGAFIKSATGNKTQHESILFKELWKELVKGDFLVTDRGFFSFGTFAQMLILGVDSLMRLPEIKVRKAIGAKLPKGDSFDVIIEWERPSQRPKSMPQEEFALLPASIQVRVLRYTIARPGFRTATVTLVTTLLDAEIEAEEFAVLYFRRWGIELHFREIKTFMQMDVLRCLTPKMIERELQMHIVAYNLIRCVMQKSALTNDVDLSRLSFKGCMDTLRQFANTMQGAENKPKTIEAMVEEMLSAIARDLNLDRPGRSEPRARKRRAKNYQLLTRHRRKMGNLPHRNRGAKKHPKSTLS